MMRLSSAISLAGQPRRVAGAVGVLVVLGDEPRHLVVAHGAQQLGADDRVGLDDAELVRVELAGLVRMSRGTAILPMSWSRAAVRSAGRRSAATRAGGRWPPTGGDGALCTAVAGSWS